MGSENAIAGKLFEIGEKLVHNAKFMVPGVGLFYLIATVWQEFWIRLSDWVTAKISEFGALLQVQLTALGVDLTPPPEFQSFIAKANSLVPLAEMWQYTLLYLAFASVVMGIKWTRNLVPGMS